MQIPGGLLYVGQGLAAPTGELEPALINPALKVNHHSPDYTGSTMGYWPSYGEITPEARAAYLQWLGTGRSHPAAYIGYVFLFFYGLERRVLVDIANDPTLNWELPPLHAEVHRLLAIYGGNDSFHRYANRFLGLLDVLTAAESSALPPLTREDRWQPPPSLLIQLGTFASGGRPIPADWALAWAWYHPDVSLRTTATRCTDEFVALFKSRYAATHNAGLVVRPTQATVGLEYYAASQGIPSATLTTTIPNVFDDLDARRQLATLAHAAMDDLEPYSRYLGRNPDGRGTVAAAALLPRELLGQPTGEVARLRSWAADLADTRRVISGDVLFARWPIKSPERMAKPEAVALAPVHPMQRTLGDRARSAVLRKTQTPRRQHPGPHQPDRLPRMGLRRGRIRLNHDITAARQHALPALYPAASQGLPPLTDKGYAGAGIGTITAAALVLLHLQRGTR